jgi:hypothetical protein
MAILGLSVVGKEGKIEESNLKFRRNAMAEIQTGHGQ